MQVQNRFEELLAIKSRKEGRSISRRDVEVETGISLTSIQNWANNRNTQYNVRQILAFCKYFKCNIGDLLILVDEQGNEIETPESKTLLSAIA